MPYRTYILTNHTDTVLYTGVTNNLERRLYEHKNGLIESSFSNQYKLYKLLWCQEFASPEDAIAAEKKIKGWSRLKKINLIKDKNPDLKNLATE